MTTAPATRTPKRAPSEHIMMMGPDREDCRLVKPARRSGGAQVEKLAYLLGKNVSIQIP